MTLDQSEHKSDASADLSFFMTNGFDGNQLVSSYIGPQGMLETGCAVWTGGNGSASINDPAPFEPHVSGTSRLS